jgi:hypothetical protein
MQINPSEAEVKGPRTCPELQHSFDNTPKGMMAAMILSFLSPTGGGVFELCVIGPARPQSSAWEGFAFGKKPIVAGCFSDQGKMIVIASQVHSIEIYIILKHCQETLINRANNRLVEGLGRDE